MWRCISGRIGRALSITSSFRKKKDVEFRQVLFRFESIKSSSRRKVSGIVYSEMCHIPSGQPQTSQKLVQLDCAYPPAPSYSLDLANRITTYFGLYIILLMGRTSTRWNPVKTSLRSSSLRKILCFERM